MSKTAPQILEAAAQHMKDRAATYDQPEGERSMGKAVAVFNLYHDTNLTEAQGWHMLQILKDVRLFQRPGYHADSAEDCTAYSALKAEAMQIKPKAEAGQTVIASASPCPHCNAVLRPEGFVAHEWSCPAFATFTADSAVKPASPLDRLPTIKRSELPAWAPGDAELYAPESSSFWAECYRVDSDGRIMPSPAVSWATSSHFASIGELISMRPELRRIIDDTHATPADPYMPPDDLWLAWWLAKFSVMLPDGTFRMMQCDPSAISVIEPLDFVAGSIRQRPAHL